MRVAQLICAGRFAGAEAVACELARSLRAQVEASLIYVIHEARVGGDLEARVRGFGLPTRVWESQGRFSPRLGTSLRRALAQDAVDVAHSHNYKPAVWAGLGPRRHRTVLTLHGQDQTRALGRAKVRAYNGLATSLSDALIYVAPPAPAGASIIPNAVQVPEAMPDRRDERRRLAARYGFDPRRAWLLFVGRLVDIKRPELALEVARLLPEVELIVCGEGPLAEALHARAPANAHLLGHIPDLAPLYGAADLLLSTSDSEGCPMSMLEGMAVGLPVVATGVGGVPKVVASGETGWLAPPGAAAPLADLVARSLADEVTLASMRHKARQRVLGEFSLERWARRHLAVYRA